MYLLTAEFDDDTVDFAEATDDEDADRLLEHYMDDGALVQIYAAASMSGHYVLLHSPVLEQDNAYEALPADILIRTIRAVGIENLRLPEGFEIPEIPESLLSTPGRTEVEE